MNRMLTERAQRVMFRAQELAGASPISPYDIMVALFEEDANAPGIQDLVRLGVDTARVSEHLREMKSKAPMQPSADGFDWTVLHTAAKEALSLGLKYVGTEFILLSLLTLGHLTPVLESLGHDPKALYSKIKAHIRQ